MTPENFVYWLQGFFELSESTDLSAKQVQVIKDHLALVMKKKTPVRIATTDNKISLSPEEINLENLNGLKKAMEALPLNFDDAIPNKPATDLFFNPQDEDLICAKPEDIVYVKTCMTC